MAKPRPSLGRFPRKRDHGHQAGNPETDPRPPGSDSGRPQALGLQAHGPDGRSGPRVHPPPCHAAKHLDPRGPGAAPQGGGPAKVRRRRTGCPSGRPGPKAARPSGPRRRPAPHLMWREARGPADVRRTSGGADPHGSAPDPPQTPTPVRPHLAQAKPGTRPHWRQCGGVRSARTLRRTQVSRKRDPRGRRTGRTLATRGPTWGARPACRRTGVVRLRPAGMGGRTGPSQHFATEALRGGQGECTCLRGLPSRPSSGGWIAFVVPSAGSMRDAAPSCFVTLQRLPTATPTTTTQQ
ncbi:MAG: hypothetical protein QOJ26_146 [Thermoplasmata archaeon]|jgi:hypothetical protein|nr:hypothetical protein [Thermoplasmata archaeon]